jgi:regulator of sirC expression with transglutaminase-like and TPR domain
VPLIELEVECMSVMVVLSTAETDALSQIQRRHSHAMNSFERDLLAQVLRKIERRQEEARLDQNAWRRFVWTADDIRVLRTDQERLDLSPDMPLPAEQRALLEYIDEVLREPDEDSE